MKAKQAENPLAPTLAQRVRIRARATKLWERDGCPLGQSEAYLERARELDALEFDCPVQLPNPIASPPATYQGTLIEEAALQENLGEFPALFTDQGETMPTPESRPIAKQFRDGER
jgi:hypothetical protein